MDKRLQDLAIKALREEVERKITILMEDLNSGEDSHFEAWQQKANLSRGLGTKAYVEHYIKYLQERVKEITDLEQAWQGLKEENHV